MEQPKGFIDLSHPYYVCTLHKSLYSLKQAPKAWFMRLSTTILEFDFVSSSVDTSLFVYHVGNCHIFFLIYIDDILVTQIDSSLIYSLINRLQVDFKLRNHNLIRYFLGIQATKDTIGLHLHQSKIIGAITVPSPCTMGQKLSSNIGESLTSA